jgi:hypothetical protein
MGGFVGVEFMFVVDKTSLSGFVWGYQRNVNTKLNYQCQTTPHKNVNTKSNERNQTTINIPS